MDYSKVMLSFNLLMNDFITLTIYRMRIVKQNTNCRRCHIIVLTISYRPNKGQ